MPACSIVQATEADLPLIAQFVRELADYERLSDAAVATEDDFRRALFGERPVAEAVIARDGAQAAGFALFFPNFSTFLGRPGLYLEDLYVRPGFRGRGVGRALLTHLARVATSRGWGRVEWAVLDWNAPAIGFYRSLGAVPMDEWTIFRLTGRALEELAAGQM